MSIVERGLSMSAPIQVCVELRFPTRVLAMHPYGHRGTKTSPALEGLLCAYNYVCPRAAVLHLTYGRITHLVGDKALCEKTFC